MKDNLIQPEDIVSDEWAEWYRLSPAQRWAQTQQLWTVYLSLGGSLDPEPDTQSPFHDALAADSGDADVRSGLRFIRRSGV